MFNENVVYPLQIIGMYFINSKSKEEIIMKGLDRCVSLLASAGFTVLAIICDQESIHQKIYRLNRNGDGTITIGGVAVSLIYDVPHLFKSTRNCFQSKEIRVRFYAYGQESLVFLRIFTDSQIVLKYHKILCMSGISLALITASDR